MKTATLDLIAKANNKPTGDELRLEEANTRYSEMLDYKNSLPKYMNSAQRRKLKKILEKQNNA